MDPDFSERHHHFFYHHHPGFGGLHQVFEWLPLLAGVLLTVAVARILLGGNQLEPTSRAVRHQRPPDPVHPVICMDETSKQLVSETRISLPTGPGQPQREDYE